MGPMIEVDDKVRIPASEVSFSAIRARGAGGQHVNKVSSAVQLRFDIRASSLPPEYQQRLLRFRDRRISSDGVVVIKADEYRSQDRNREAAIERLVQLIVEATKTRAKRVATRPSRGARQRRMDSKTRRGRVKALRGKVDE